MDKNETGLWNRMRRNVLQGVGWDGDELWEGMRHGTEEATGCEAMDVG